MNGAFAAIAWETPDGCLNTFALFRPMGHTAKTEVAHRSIEHLR